jgi:hypothetical protein
VNGMHEAIVQARWEQEMCRQTSHLERKFFALLSLESL